MATSEKYLLKTWYEDEDGINHHLSVEPMEGKGTAIFYHCIIDGTKQIDVEMGNEKWQDVEKKDGKLAETIGTIIEDYSE